mmetsp:Transcript_310/g.1179  ORF Transcript_310/g.1179 Transcript_310/m.1179 type:complete len:205 (+) Transcript_310:1868-2482(+)
MISWFMSPSRCASELLLFLSSTGNSSSFRKARCKSARIPTVSFDERKSATTKNNSAPTSTTGVTTTSSPVKLKSVSLPLPNAHPAWSILPHLLGVSRSPAYASAASVSFDSSSEKTFENARATNTHTAADELKPFAMGNVVLWLLSTIPGLLCVAMACLTRSLTSVFLFLSASSPSPSPSITLKSNANNVPATWDQNPPAFASV